MSHGAVRGRKRFPKMLFCGTRTGNEAQPPEAGPAMRCAVVEDSLRAGDGPSAALDKQVICSLLQESAR